MIDPAVARAGSVEELTRLLGAHDYLADRGLATAAFVALRLGRPLLLEGEVGVGKTELARTLATAFGRRLIRLQCHEGIDAHQALYEWDHVRQMLQIRLLSQADARDESAVDDLYSARYLVDRPLLEAIRAGDQCVLLIDEIDRADDEFEAFLLEVLSEFQITIPEIGTIRAETRPIVILTSNRTRELHDALKRRCLYHWIGFPPVDREIEIVRARLPEATERIATKVVAAVNRLRALDLAKPPGVAETLDWVESLDAIGADDLTSDTARDTLGAVIKDQEDLELVQGHLDGIVDDAH
ncbi:MAG: MoxR family ATPase [Nitriliruptoraceae bacterium]